MTDPKKVNEELADNAIADPFETPRFLELEGEPNSRERLLQYVLIQMMPKDGVKRIPLIATPASQPRNVLDAKATQECDVCNEKVWISPSTERLLNTSDETFFITCLACFCKVADPIMEKSKWHER